jgi:hypothetical protein
MKACISLGCLLGAAVPPLSAAGVILALLTVLPAAAHKPSDSYLKLRVAGAQVQGQWDIALRDLDNALVLDADGDGRITWGEVRARHADIAAYAGARLVVSADGQPCALSVGTQQIDEHTDGAYSVLPLLATCPAPVQTLRLRYTLFADLDPQHRGLLSLGVVGAADATGATGATGTAGAASATHSAGAVRTVVLGPAQPEQDFAVAGPDAPASDPWRTLRDYVVEGVWHIWIGFDHILFLLSLLLPAVGVWVARRFTPVEGFKAALWDVVRVVTAFTVAHSITLSLAALGVVSLPSRLVESAIAGSVVLAALNNVWPLFEGRRWVVAFAFGLLHGFGFASVLADLGLPQGALALALFGFNVGVELGQLAIVVVFLPLAYVLRRTAFYRKGVLVGGSLAIALLAAVWLAERALGLELL